MNHPIDVYTWPTPNGHKIHILLEELGLAYRAHPVDIHNNEQFSPEFLAINPNNKIPAIVDHDGPQNEPITLFESGAILLYLAEKHGQFIGNTPTERYQVIQWLMFQMGGLGPMLGQAHHFRLYATERIPYAYDRYTNEAKRLYRVLDKQLASTHAFIAGSSYSIADIACYPWMVKYANQGIDLNHFPHVKQWLQTIQKRPAVQRGMAVLSESSKK